MKKIFLGLFILFDLALIAGAGFFLYTYIKHKSPSFSASTPTSATARSMPSTGPSSTGTVKAMGEGLVGGSSEAESATRKILFSYRNPKAKQVSIRADFTGWKADTMHKGAGGVWTYQAQLAPGEYAYCYTADDKTFKDPANKHTKVIGRTTVSAIVVEALPAKKSK